MSRQFDFPTLSEKDVVANLVDLGVSKEDAQATLKAVPDAVRRVYEYLLDKVCNLGRESRTPDFRCSGHLRYSEIYDDAIDSLELFNALKRWLHSCGVPDFGLMDLMEPQSKRVRRHLSALMNFTRFCEWKGELEDELEEQAEELMEKNNELIRSLKEISAEYEREMQAQERQQQVVDDLEEQKRAQAENMRRVGQDWSTCAAHVEQLKGERDDFACQAKSLQIRELDARNEQAELRSRLVDAPDKLLEDIQNVKSALAHTHNINTQIEQETYSYKQRGQTVSKLAREVGELTSYAAETLAKALQEKKQVNQELKSKKAELEQAHREHDLLMGQGRQWQQQIQTAREAQGRDAKKNAAKLDSAKSTLEMARRAMDKAQAQVEVLQAGIQTNELQAKRQREKREEFEVAVASQVARLLGKCKEAEHALAQYHAPFASLEA